MAQPHILSQVCGVYVSYECEAGLESVHIGGKRPSVAQPDIFRFVICEYFMNLRLVWSQCIVMVSHISMALLSDVA